MRYFRYAFLGILAILLITVALANRDAVVLQLLPDTLAEFAGLNTALSVPLFIVIFASVIIGVLIGFVWEWLREHKHRAAVTAERREKERLSRELSRLHNAKSEKPGDDVLALLEDTGAAR